MVCKYGAKLACFGEYLYLNLPRYKWDQKQLAVPVDGFFDLVRLICCICLWNGRLTLCIHRMLFGCVCIMAHCL